MAIIVKLNFICHLLSWREFELFMQNLFKENRKISVLLERAQQEIVKRASHRSQKTWKTNNFEQKFANLNTFRLGDFQELQQWSVQVTQNTKTCCTRVWSDKLTNRWQSGWSNGLLMQKSWVWIQAFLLECTNKAGYLPNSVYLESRWVPT